MLAKVAKSWVLFFVILAAFVGVFFLAGKFLNKKNTNEPEVLNSPILTAVSSPSPEISAPLSSKEDIVRTFCELIDEGRISDAVFMMDLKDDAERQSWAVSLNNFSSFKLVNIKESKIDKTRNSFEVDIDVSLKKNLADLPIPNYGWVDGINKRWINLKEVETGKYKIAGIATGP
jgi:hypothetical protein